MAGTLVGKAILGLVVIGCICISVLFAFEFGFAKGATPLFQWAYGFACGGLDLLKSAMPILGAAALAARQRIKASMCAAVFCFLVVMNLWAAWGTTAGQLNERMGAKAAITSDQNLKQARVDRLRAEKVSAYVPTTQATVDAAKSLVMSAEAQATVECGPGRGGRGRRCREREEDVRNARKALMKVEQEFASTALAKELAARLRAAEADLAAVDVKTVAKDVDPQSASIAVLFNIERSTAELIGHWIFAIGIEIGSGFGLWLVFGHGTPRREPIAEPVEVEVLPTQPTTISERDRFFKECVFPSPGNRVAHSDVYTAYVRWCYANEIRPMSKQAFGRDPVLAKDKIGGVVYYLECDLAPMAALVPQLRVVNA